MEESRLRIFEIRLLRSICGRKRNEVRRERGILDNDELNYLYSLPNTVRVIKSRRMRWVGMNPLKDPDVDGRMLLRWIFRIWDVRAWIGSIWPRIGTGGGHL